MVRFLERLILRRFAARLVLVVFGATLLSQIAYLVHTTTEQAEDIDRVLQAQAGVLAGSVAATAATGMVSGDLDSLEQLLRQVLPFPGVASAQITDGKGRALADLALGAEGQAVVRFGSTFTPPSLAGPQTGAVFQSTASALLIWQPVRAGSMLGWVRIEYHLAWLRKTKQEMWREHWLLGLLAPMLSTVAILFYLRRPLRHLRSATQFARRLSGGQGEQLATSPATLEFRALNHALNQASSSLAQARQQADREAEKLITSEKRSRAILRTMRDGMVHIDAQGKILAVNDAVLTMFGYREQELVGHKVNVLMPEPHRSAHDAYLARYLSQRKGQIVGQRPEMEGVRRDGSRLAVEIAVNEMVDDHGTTFIGIVRDITAQKAAQYKLENALAAAEAAAEARSRFLANMSHEIRTPINAVLGFAHLCQRLPLPTRARDYVDKIHSAASSLLGIINDVLDFSKIEAGKLEMESIPFSLGEVLHREASLFKLKAKEKGVELVIGSLPGIPEKLLGDPLRLGQVLTNLLGNAIKFTERGEVSLTVEPVTVANEAAVLRFIVRDTGVGLSAEQCGQLFNAFIQADSSTTRKYGGTGLGLAISKQLVERMGGAFNVESMPGVGSSFSFTARFALVASQAGSVLAHSSLADKRVLVVDDNVVMRNLLRKSMEGFGCRAEDVDSGEAALARLQAGMDFDLILLDWHLPGLDGLATAHCIRMAGNAIPIVLVTGDEPEVARAQASGNDIQAFLAKPIIRRVLHDTLVRVFEEESAPDDPPVPAQSLPVPLAPPNLSGARILLVDDNDFNRQVGRELVELTSATVDTADDGAQAISAATSRHYDLVLMDLQMPVMDGYVAARALRGEQPALPILALTAHALVEERARILSAGMNDILTKPIVPYTLFAMLAHWLPLHLAHTTPDPASVVEKAETATLVTALESPPVGELPSFDHPPEGFDFVMALARVNGNRAILARFLRLFLERNAGNITEIAAALAQDDPAAAKRLAHALKGAAGTIGALALQDAAARLEAELATTPQPNKEAALAAYSALQAIWSQAWENLSRMLDASAEQKA